MINNDILRRLRYTLDLSNEKTVAIFKLGNQDISQAELMGILSKEDDDNFIVCTDRQLSGFLDGLITDKRGPRDPNAPAIKPNIYAQLSNNDILKKLRIAFEFKENDMLSTIALGGMTLSPHELSALFRKKNHKHYKPCGDQLLRNFLTGLTTKIRPTPANKSPK